VQAVTVSENGLFSGTDSGTDVDVEGYTASKLAEKSNSYDRSDLTISKSWARL